MAFLFLRELAGQIPKTVERWLFISVHCPS